MSLYSLFLLSMNSIFHLSPSLLQKAHIDSLCGKYTRIRIKSMIKGRKFNLLFVYCLFLISFDFLRPQVMGQCLVSWLHY